MRPLLPLLLAALLVGLVTPGPLRAEDERPAPPPPASLKELGRRLDELALRIRKLVEEGQRDPDERKIDKYNDYSPDELKLRRRSVDAEMLVKFMVDGEKKFPLREKARDAIIRAARVRPDPDLSQTEKQGRQSRRAYFSERYVVKHLRHDDAVSRKLTHELLVGLWGNVGAGVPTIAAYNPNDEKTWKPAYNEWKKYLRKN